MKEGSFNSTYTQRRSAKKLPTSTMFIAIIIGIAGYLLLIFCTDKMYNIKSSDIATVSVNYDHSRDDMIETIDNVKQVLAKEASESEGSETFEAFGDYTEEDFKNFTRCVWGEARASYEGAVAVCQCILYRCKVKNESITAIVSADNQFTGWSGNPEGKTNELVTKACKDSLKGTAPDQLDGENYYFFYTESYVKYIKKGAKIKVVDGNLFYQNWGDATPNDMSGNPDYVKYTSK